MLRAGPKCVLGRRARVAGVTLLGLAAVAPVRADEMDTALERLNAGDGCAPGSVVCPDQLRFERLASELVAATALPAMGPAASLGSARFAFLLGATVTDIDGGASHWRLGSEGDGAERSPSGRNTAPMPVLVWNRVEASKGLPYGLDLGVDLAQGLRTSLWTPGLWLKWSPFEGFPRRYGPLPDLALRAGVSRSVGSSQITAHVAALELAISRSFVVAHAWSLAPFLGASLLLAHVETQVIDFTPGSDAFAQCAPDPLRGGACTGAAGDADVANSVAFDDLDQVRARVAGGVEASWYVWRVRMTLQYDVAPPVLPAADGGDDGLRQLAFDVALGAVL